MVVASLEVIALIHMRTKSGLKPGTDGTCSGLEEARVAHRLSEGLKIRRILVPTDFSECANKALEYATVFAEAMHASIVLLHVVEPTAGGDNYLSAGPARGETNDHLVEAGREKLDGLCHRRIGHRVPWEALVRMGWAPPEICDTGRALGVDLIIMGTYGHTATESLPLGSTAGRVVCHADCPVLTVQHTER